MFLELLIVNQIYSRPSKNGHQHNYTRRRTIARFLCDNCQKEFNRPLGKMNRKRLSNEYYHVCANCDAKRFAQQKGAKKRRIWNSSADIDLNIDDI